MPVVRILEHGQVTLPKPFREALGLEKGDLAEASLEGERVVFIPKKLVKNKALQELMELLDRVHERNKDFSEEEVTQDVLEAIADLREKEYVQHKKTECAPRY
ncbi:AbrB/MazE/SpoVT family DNA-binding domain-containing protein [Candidatus Poribacteria bacterium]|nr:AbrB/MazE/SpoVT family DNA-binding domain-containing protein [Candidatus Poribacteria bacterium]